MSSELEVLKSILPPPFDMCEVPSGNVILRPMRDYDYFDVGSYVTEVIDIEIPRFFITKYPLTHAQYAEFVRAGGHQNKQWWGGLQLPYQYMEEPYLWHDTKWNGVEQPVIGLDLEEASAFCRWLSHVSQLKITLPTDKQWLRAARGNTDSRYPWGNTWDSRKANHSCYLNKSDTTSSVLEYEDKGNQSPFGLVDLIGNVWEMCSTNYDSGEEFESGSKLSNRYVIRGGAWNTQDLYKLSLDYFGWGNCFDGSNNMGFRFICMLD